uniref:Uncharacterized protein LOC114347335 n=1 Tax=Diabrotica virgifera virgifera TaxID=50390 RepID=A0A6P7H832_DIAVI
MIIKQYRNLNEKNYLKIKTNLISYNWNLDSTDVDVIYQQIHENCKIEIDNNAPIQTCKHNPKLPWFDNEVYKKIKNRDDAYKNFKSCGHETQKQVMWNNFKKHRNDVVSTLKSKKSAYYYNQIDNYRSNPKKMWKTLKKLVNTNTKDTPKCVQFRCNITGEIAVKRDSMDISMGFNEYFVESISSIVSHTDFFNIG